MILVCFLLFCFSFIWGEVGAGKRESPLCTQLIVHIEASGAIWDGPEDQCGFLSSQRIPPRAAQTISMSVR